MLPVIVVVLVLGGLLVPRVAMWCSILCAVGRLIFSVMYVRKGSNARIVGGVIGTLPIYILAILTYIEIIRWIFF